MKIYNYIVIMITMILFLEFTGFHTPAGNMLSSVGVNINNQTSTLESVNIKQSQFYNDLFGKGIGLLALVTLIGGVIVGFFTKQFDWKLVIVTFMVWIAGLFVGTGVSLIFYVKGIPEGGTWLVAIITTIFLPIIIGFIYSFIEFFGVGGD